MIGTSSTGPLAGLRVFVAEDEVHVLQMMEDMLIDLGCVITDSVCSTPAGVEKAAVTEAQVALLDVNLRGQPIYPVAQILRDRGIPMLFASGYGAGGIDAGWRGYPVIQKPFAFELLEAALTQLVSRKPQVG